MSVYQWIDTDWDCPICGDVLRVHTDAGQAWAGGEGLGWWAYDDDLVRCPDCGAEGSTMINIGTTILLDLDDSTPHNIACAEAYKAREKRR